MKNQNISIIPTIFDNSWGYLISKMYDYSTEVPPIKEMGLICCRELKDGIAEIKSNLDIKKWLEKHPRIDFHLLELDYPLNKIESYLSNKVIMTNNDYHIYLFFISEKTDELLILIKELELSYNKTN